MLALFKSKYPQNYILLPLAIVIVMVVKYIYGLGDSDFTVDLTNYNILTIPSNLDGIVGFTVQVALHVVLAFQLYLITSQRVIESEKDFIPSYFAGVSIAILIPFGAFDILLGIMLCLLSLGILLKQLNHGGDQFIMEFFSLLSISVGTMIYSPVIFTVPIWIVFFLNSGVLTSGRSLLWSVYGAILPYLYLLAIEFMQTGDLNMDTLILEKFRFLGGSGIESMLMPTFVIMLLITVYRFIKIQFIRGRRSVKLIKLTNNFSVAYLWSILLFIAPMGIDLWSMILIISVGSVFVRVRIHQSVSKRAVFLTYTLLIIFWISLVYYSNGNTEILISDIKEFVLDLLN